MANANIVDELIVRLRLDAAEYRRADKEVDKLASDTERKAKRRDKDQQKRFKDSAAAARQFTGTLKSLALTIGSVLGIGGGAAGLVGAVVALTNFETNLRRAAVSTGLSNREMQAWGSAARRLGADAQAGAQAIADLAREQKQGIFKGEAPTIQALSQFGVGFRPGEKPLDLLARAQEVYRKGTPAQKDVMETGLSASGVSADLILLIKSEADVRKEFAQSYAESTDENAKASKAVVDALEALKNSGIKLTATLVETLQPQIEAFAEWTKGASAGISEFGTKVTAAGGGVDGFMKVLDQDSPALSATLKALSSAVQTLGETIDVAIYGLKSSVQGLDAAGAWLDKKFGQITGGPNNQLATAGQSIVDAVGSLWNQTVRDARRQGPAPVGTVTGSAGGVRLTPSARARVAAGELSGRPAAAVANAGGRPSAQDVMQYLIGQGLTVQQAAAVAANLQGESTMRGGGGVLDPEAFNAKGGGQGAHGLAQWRGGRVNAFRAANQGMFPSEATWQQQLNFMLTDPYERRLLNRSLSGGGGAAEFGTRFSQIFEAHGNVAEDLRRGRAAQQLAQQYNAATGTVGTGGPQIAINGPVTVQANNPQEFISGVGRVVGVTNYSSAVR